MENFSHKVGNAQVFHREGGKSGITFRTDRKNFNLHFHDIERAEKSNRTFFLYHSTGNQVARYTHASNNLIIYSHGDIQAQFTLPEKEAEMIADFLNHVHFHKGWDEPFKETIQKFFEERNS